MACEQVSSVIETVPRQMRLETTLRDGRQAVSPLRPECYESDSRGGPPRALGGYACKSFGLVEVDRWQVAHLVFGEV
jgi:hypothetical protein